MRLNPRLVVFAALVACGAAIAGTATSSGAPKIPTKIPKVKTRVAHLEVDVAGYVETRKLKDTTSDCFPGVTYTQTNRFEFETGRYVPITISNISLPGHDSVMTSRFSKAGGTATVEGLLSGYRTTNYCLPTAPQKEPEKPKCKKLRGKIAVALTPSGSTINDELVTLGGTRLMLSIERRQGGSEDLTCAGAGAQSVQSVDKNAVVTTSFAPGVSEVLPSGLGAIKVFSLRRNKRLRKVIIIDGPCASVNAAALTPPAHSPSAGSLNADGDCRLTGKVVLNVRTIQ
jgi:hypothetical protein